MMKAFSRFRGLFSVTGALLALSLMAAAPSHAVSVALNGNYFDTQISGFLTGNGHTVVNDVDLTMPITADALYLLRDVSLSPAEAAGVLSYLSGGGTVLTEFSQTNSWFNGTLSSFSGTLVDGFYIPSGSVVGGNTATVTDSGDELAAGLPGSWTTSDPIGVWQAYTGLDAAISQPIKLLGSAYGDIPIVGHASVNGGCAVLFFTDFGDWSDTYPPTAEEQQLLLNAVTADCGSAAPAPEPSTLALFGLGAAGLLKRLRGRTA
jgi:hypothetical protein